uniref:NACHT LRR and PYD domain-containing protein n=1 Tax=Paramormyrops kingsleyae TaxID=1676925 RepID=A0A3B3T9U9_9TELE
MDSCQTLLQGILSRTGIRSHDTQRTASYIKEKIRENLPSERTINLFHCLNELNDTSLVEEVQRYLRLGRISTESLSPAQWSALVFVLFSDCGVTDTGCASLASALWSNPSHLRELDLSNNNTGDSGVIQLSARVKRFSLSLYRLSGCRVTDIGCAILAPALWSNPSHLRELDLSGNNTGDSGVIQLSAVLEDPKCQLQTLRLSGCRVTDIGCAILASALRSNPSHLRELDLSDNNTGDSGVIELSDVLEDPKCQLQKLRLSGCRVTDTGCASLASALWSNPSHLRELDLSGNNTGDSGVIQLSAVLKDPKCQLQKLRLSDCRVTDTGCASLASALRSNPSHLRELDLSYNNTGDSGVIQLSAVLEDPKCQLQTLRLVVNIFLTALSCLSRAERVKSFSPSFYRMSGCRVTDTGCASLASALRSNPSHLRELDLSDNNTGDSGVIQLSAVLEDPKSLQTYNGPMAPIPTSSTPHTVCLVRGE